MTDIGSVEYQRPTFASVMLASALCIMASVVFIGIIGIFGTDSPRECLIGLSHPLGIVPPLDKNCLE